MRYTLESIEYINDKQASIQTANIAYHALKSTPLVKINNKLESNNRESQGSLDFKKKMIL